MIIHLDQTSAVEPLDRESTWESIESEDEMLQTYLFGL